MILRKFTNSLLINTFRFATKAGLEMGQRIGEHVAQHSLTRESR